MRFRPGLARAAALLLALLLSAGEARAAADVHRLSLVIAGIPTQVKGGDFGDYIDHYNLVTLDAMGFERLPKVQFTWMYESELRFFARPNFAITAGVGQLRATQKREFLPAISQAVNVRAELLTVPVHVGAAYYLQPYNQGDFQARAYFGGGVVQYTHSRATFEQVLSNPDLVSNARLGGSTNVVLTQDAPGWYAEGGAHMFFASRFSVLIGAVWRSGDLRNVVMSEYQHDGVTYPVIPPGVPVSTAQGQPFRMDVGGLGLKLAVGIGF